MHAKVSDHRRDAVGEVSNEDVHLPVIAPKIPGRFYFLFGKPIETLGLFSARSNVLRYDR